MIKSQVIVFLRHSVLVYDKDNIKCYSDLHFLIFA